MTDRHGIVKVWPQPGPTLKGIPASDPSYGVVRDRLQPSFSLCWILLLPFPEHFLINSLFAHLHH